MNLESFPKKENPKFENIKNAFKQALQENGLPLHEIVRAMKASMSPEELVAIGYIISQETNA